MRRFLSVALLLFAMQPIAAIAQPVAAKTLKIGVLAFRSKEATLQRWQPTADYLSQNCTNFKFEVLPLNYPELEQAISDHSVDFVLTNSGHYVTLEADFGITRLATLVKLVQGIPSSVFGGVIFCRADQEDLQTIADLKNHSFKAVGQFSLGGYLAARMELLAGGIDINKDLNFFSFTGMPHDQVVMAVLAGEVDAGTMRTSVLENMDSEGIIDLNSIKILGAKQNEEFPFIHSTALYPEWPISSMPHIGPQLRRSVAKVLMEITADDKAAQVGLYHQWTIPANYQSIHNMMRQLRIGPYATAGPFNRKDAINQYQTEIMVIGIIMAFTLSIVALRLFHLNRKLIRAMKERRIVEAERAEIKAELHRSQKMEAIGVLAGGVAHDLNNILTGLVSYPEIILMDLPEKSPVREDVQTVLDMGERAAAVVADLLTVSRAVVATPELLNARDEIHHYKKSLEFSQLQVDFPRVKYHWKLDDISEGICCSKSHFRSSLMNLVINATEAVLGNGIVEIKSRTKTLSSTLSGYESIPPGHYGVISINDSGPGISNENMERIFEPFFTRKVMGKSGTGLGLSIVWNTMHNHSGYINLKSDSDGTCFDLYFQTSCHDTSNQQKDIPLSELQGNGEKILVVDDEITQRNISCRMLAELGYQPTSVSSGEEAIIYLKNNPVHMVILDMIMDPGINGLETYKELRKINPDLKAMVASGYAEKNAIDPMMALGANQFLYKPYNLRQLALSVFRTLES